VVVTGLAGRIFVCVVVSVFVLPVIVGLHGMRVKKKRAPVGAGARSRGLGTVSPDWAAHRTVARIATKRLPQRVSLAEVK
jgi:hypothetical protein